MKSLIGNTPLIKIKYKYNDKEGNIYAKLEYYNLTGSIKDRMAYEIINESISTNKLKRGMPIVEASSGNAGISFAAIGAMLGSEVHIFMPDWVSVERVDILKLYGAKVHLISKSDGGFVRCIEEADKLAKKINGYRPKQFENFYNMKAHFKTGKEIVKQLNGNDIGGFVSGIGTGGTLMGVGSILKSKNKDIKIVALEPDTSPLISKSKVGEHKIEGIGDDFIPKLVDLKTIDDVILINDNDAINMARKVASTLGIGIGISSGANLLGAILLSDMIGKDVVTVFPDDLKKYLSTSLTKEIKDKNLISNNVEILGYEVI